MARAAVADRLGERHAVRLVDAMQSIAARSGPRLPTCCAWSEAARSCAARPRRSASAACGRGSGRTRRGRRRSRSPSSCSSSRPPGGTSAGRVGERRFSGFRAHAEVRAVAERLVLDARGQLRELREVALAAAGAVGHDGPQFGERRTGGLHSRPAAPLQMCPSPAEQSTLARARVLAGRARTPPQGVQSRHSTHSSPSIRVRFFSSEASRRVRAGLEPPAGGPLHVDVVVAAPAGQDGLPSGAVGRRHDDEARRSYPADLSGCPCTRPCTHGRRPVRECPLVLGLRCACSCSAERCVRDLPKREPWAVLKYTSS